MKKEKLLLISIIAAVLVGCLVGVGLLLSRDDSGVDATIMPTASQDPPTQDPDEPTDSDEPNESENTQKVQFVVTLEDGSVALGAAVLATHSSGRQVFAPTAEEGIATLELLSGMHAVHFVCDGQTTDLEIQVDDDSLRKTVQLQDRRKLYILMSAAGAYESDARDLAGFSVLENTIKEKYPNATYLTDATQYDVDFNDGDALLTIEIFVENYITNEQYFASELRVRLQTYQECITTWGEEVETDFFDGSTYNLRIRNDYDYDYKDSVSVITGSYYVIQKNWHVGSYSCRADDWSYGYIMDDLRSSTSEQKTKVPGAGMKTESFWFDLNSNRYQDYCGYAEQVFPVIDLWLSDEWNQKIQTLEF